MRDWLKNPAIRHFIGVLVSVSLSLVLPQYLPPAAAGAISNAAGAAVEGHQ